MKLSDKVAIVTGAGRGIGRGIAGAFAREGANLVLVARNMRQVEEAAQETRNLGVDAIALSVDVADPAQVRSMVDQTLAHYSRVDILVNKAAIMGPVGSLQINDMQQWADTIRINVTGLALCCQAVIPAMIEAGGGSIINLSGTGVVGPAPTLSACSTSKAAVIRFTETLALEVRKHNICVNALGPGQIDTQFLDAIAEAEDGVVQPESKAGVLRTRAGQGASLENAAALAVWLASDESDDLTGRMISAVQDDWRHLRTRIPEIMASDSHTLRFVAE